MGFKLTDLLNWTRTETIRAVQAQREIPPMVKVALAGGLAMMSDPDYLRYAKLISDVIAALVETEKGQKVLDDIGIEYEAPAVVTPGQD